MGIQGTAELLHGGHHYVCNGKPLATQTPLRTRLRYHQYFICGEACEKELERPGFLAVLASCRSRDVSARKCNALRRMATTGLKVKLETAGKNKLCCPFGADGVSPICSPQVMLQDVQDGRIPSGRTELRHNESVEVPLD